jgi:hypothetical protein
MTAPDPRDVETAARTMWKLGPVDEMASWQGFLGHAQAALDAVTDDLLASRPPTPVSDEPQMAPDCSKDLELEDYTAWFTVYPTTHRLAGQTVEVVPRAWAEAQVRSLAEALRQAVSWSYGEDVTPERRDEVERLLSLGDEVPK